MRSAAGGARSSEAVSFGLPAATVVGLSCGTERRDGRQPVRAAASPPFSSPSLLAPTRAGTEWPLLLRTARPREPPAGRPRGLRASRLRRSGRRYRGSVAAPLSRRHGARDRWVRRAGPVPSERLCARRPPPPRYVCALPCAERAWR